MPPYKNPQEALAGTTALAQPTNDAQRQAIAFASSQVPNSSAITPSALTPTTPITPVTPKPLEVPVAPVLTPPGEAPKTDLYAPSESENRLYSAMQRLQGDTNLLGSEETFKTQQEQRFGVQEKQGIVNTLKNKFDALTAEANGIDLQQSQALDQNRALGGSSFQVGANDAATQREFNRKKLGIAIQQHSIAAEHAVASGELGTALSLADRAVKMEYQPRKDALDAQRANLELALKDPTLTQEQKKRADAQALAIDAEKAKVAKEEKNAQDTNDARIKAINVNLGNPNLAKAMDALRASKTPLDVAGVLAFYGLTNEKKDTQVTKLDNGQTVVVDTQTGEVISNLGGAKPTGVDSDQLYSGLSPTTATAVRSKVGKFSTEPIVQNFATIQEGRNFASSINTDTQNPADDQALIYSLAKALDPGSVVREGEYATAQKYAQSWINSFGKGVEQALLGTGFLSKDARENIKKTIEQKYTSSKKSYDNAQKSYVDGINKLTGRANGSDFLVDYITPDSDSSTGAIITAPDGTEIELID